jgi:hypothetical protein
MGHRVTGLVVLFVLSIAMSGVTDAQTSPAPAAAPSPIATADSETPGVQLQVTKLKRVGDSVMLQIVLINNSDSSYDPQKLDGSGAGRRNADGVFLLDLAGKKKYEVVRDSDQQCLCSHDLQPMGAKSRLTVWAKFPAPPDNVKKLGVVAPHFLPMDDVPLSQ